jgi:methionyl-tRNA formyltransferase
MLLAGRTPIGPATTAPELHDRLAEMGARLVLEALEGIASGRLVPTPQPAEGITYAAKLQRDEGALDWRRPADELLAKVRALNPWPGVSFESPAGRIKVLAAEPAEGVGPPGAILDDRLSIATGAGAFRPTRVQRAGREPASTADFLRGCPLPAGTVLPCPATS